MYEATNIDQGQHHTAQHLQAGREVEQQHPCGDEYTQDGQEYVPVQLFRYNLKIFVITLKILDIKWFMTSHKYNNDVHHEIRLVIWCFFWQ